MKKSMIGFIPLLLISCKHEYQVNVQPDLPENEYSILQYNDRITLNRIDGIEFKSKSNFLQAGSHHVRLEPGRHTFRFGFFTQSAGGYEEKSWSMKIQTGDNNTISTYLEPGK